MPPLGKHCRPRLRLGLQCFLGVKFYHVFPLRLWYLYIVTLPFDQSDCRELTEGIIKHNTKE